MDQNGRQYNESFPSVKEIELKCGSDKAVRQMIHRAIKKQYPMLSSTTRNGVIVVSRGGGRKGLIQTLLPRNKFCFFKFSENFLNHAKRQSR